MKIKTLSKKNQHKINFDIKCLPEWANYIAMNANAQWHAYENEPIISHESDDWFEHPSHLIRSMDNPTLFNGNWKDSMFKIDRS